MYIETHSTRACEDLHSRITVICSMHTLKFGILNVACYWEVCEDVKKIKVFFFNNFILHFYVCEKNRSQKNC